ncbi:hypothetical protein DPM19_05890 [Actinomadura craniellae]|uniref:Uncharacterized protein n=1 Tax=Actinomadura craniellae TaxID=2231787 RepID=A0A365HB76_9ACTN|nr:hypothetical protein DPM19_05890 [Actinomadura craniellae]
MPRSRGALSGVLLVLAGLWGGLIPFIGPYFNFAFTPDEPWVWTANRFWLSVLPALATVLGGLILLFSANRIMAMLGGGLAALGGLWFILGGPLSTLWTATGVPATGTPVGGQTRRLFEQLAFFEGIGSLILLLSALALGRLAVVGVKEARMAAEGHARPGRHERGRVPEPVREPVQQAPAREPVRQAPARAPEGQESGATVSPRGRYARPEQPEHKEHWVDRVRHLVHR